MASLINSQEIESELSKTITEILQENAEYFKESSGILRKKYNLNYNILLQGIRIQITFNKNPYRTYDLSKDINSFDKLVLEIINKINKYFTDIETKIPHELNTYLDKMKQGRQPKPLALTLYEQVNVTQKCINNFKALVDDINQQLTPSRGGQKQKLNILRNSRNMYKSGGLKHKSRKMAGGAASGEDTYSGAGIDTATFEQLKATLYKANGGALVKTKKRSVRRGGVEPGDVVQAVPPGDEDEDCPIFIKPFADFLMSKKGYTEEAIENLTEENLELLYNEFNPRPTEGGRKKRMQRRVGGVIELKNIALCLKKYMANIASASGFGQTLGATVGVATSATREALNTAAAAWLNDVGKNNGREISDPEVKAYLTSSEFNNKLQTYIGVMNLSQLQTLVGTLSALIGRIPAETAGGARRKARKQRGGVETHLLDQNKMYNVQGLIGNSFIKDPVDMAATIPTDATPFPFSAGSSAGISYTSGINQDFINQLTPALGQVGGRRLKSAADGGRRLKSAADGGRARKTRKAKRGGVETQPTLTQAEATKLIIDFLTLYDRYSDGANFASHLKPTHDTLLGGIYIIIMNAFLHLRGESPLVKRTEIATLVKEEIKSTKPIPEMPIDAANIYTQIELLDPNSISFGTHSIDTKLYDEGHYIDIGLLQVLLEKIINYLNGEAIFTQVNSYYNMIIRKAYTDQRKEECVKICDTIYNECQKYKALAEKLLAHINDLIDKGFYKSAYNVDAMRRDISFARVAAASEEIHKTIKQGANILAQQYAPGANSAAGGGRVRKARKRV